jgi:hypothetical protein
VYGYSSETSCFRIHASGFAEQRQAEHLTAHLPVLLCASLFVAVYPYRTAAGVENTWRIKIRPKLLRFTLERS